MRNFFLCLLVIGLFLGSAPTAFAQQTEPPPPPPPKPNANLKPFWQEFTASAGNFKVEFPGKPQEQTQNIKSTAGDFLMHLFIVENAAAVYLASYVDFPILIDSPASIKTALDNGRDSMLARKDASLISEKEIAYGLYPGREIKAKLGNLAVRTYIYLVKQRLYNLSVFAPTELADNKDSVSETQRFLASFKLLEIPKLPENVAALSSALDGLKDPPPDFFARPAAWQELSAPELGFKITIPSSPFKQTVAVSPSLPDLKLTLWLAKADDLVCTVVYQSLANSPKNEREAGFLLNSLLGGLIDAGSVKIVSETPLSLDGHPGRELKLQMGSNGMGRGRAYVVGKNVYAFLAISVGEKPNDQAIARVLDSFKLIPVPDK